LPPGDNPAGVGRPQQVISAVRDQQRPAPAEAPADESSALPDTAPAPVSSTNDFRGAVASYERQLLEDALGRNRFNQRATAAALGLSYDQLRHALKRHQLTDAAN